MLEITCKQETMIKEVYISKLKFQDYATIM